MEVMITALRADDMRVKTQSAGAGLAENLRCRLSLMSLGPTRTIDARPASVVMRPVDPILYAYSRVEAQLSRMSSPPNFTTGAEQP